MKNLNSIFNICIGVLIACLFFSIYGNILESRGENPEVGLITVYTSQDILYIDWNKLSIELESGEIYQATGKESLNELIENITAEHSSKYRLE